MHATSSAASQPGYSRHGLVPSLTQTINLSHYK